MRGGCVKEVARFTRRGSHAFDKKGEWVTGYKRVSNYESWYDGCSINWCVCEAGQKRIFWLVS